MKTSPELYQRAEIIAKCHGSFLFFLQTFYELLNHREFILSNPINRESHFITVSRELVACQRLEVNRLLLNIPPGYGKSTMLSFWVAWCFTHNPDCRFLYVSCSQSLAATHTDTIRRIMLLPEYTELFDVHLRADSKAKDFFQTTAGGAVAAFGSTGTIVGRDAGYPGLDRFSGALIIDDAHKPHEAHSDTMRETVIKNYRETLQIRCRGMTVPIIFIGQRVHERDLAQYIIDGNDGAMWKHVILKGLDDNGNCLYPEAYPLEWMYTKRKYDIYVYAAQVQQNPQPAGGSLFQTEWFLSLDEEPEILATFIVSDTAETDKTWNDATVFGFFGVYRTLLGKLAIHCLHLEELRVEPHALELAFMDFWRICMTHPVKPLKAFYEKKSTGTTLISVLRNVQGLAVLGIERTKKSGCKTQRFLNAQPSFAAKLMTFPRFTHHNKLVVDHMAKITANETHAFDDIADVCCDAVRIALIEQGIVYGYENTNNAVKEIMDVQRVRIEALERPW